VFKRLLTICQHRKPEYESQVRPLVGLTAEQAQAAWECAVQRGDCGELRKQATVDWKWIAEKLHMGKRQICTYSSLTPLSADAWR
jgi:hypothetical protein